MSVAKVIEIIASSDKSFDDAVAQGVAQAGKSVENITSAWVQDHKVTVTKGAISEWRVNLKVTFVIKD